MYFILQYPARQRKRAINSLAWCLIVSAVSISTAIILCVVVALDRFHDDNPISAILIFLLSFSTLMAAASIPAVVDYHRLAITIVYEAQPGETLPQEYAQVRRISRAHGQTILRHFRYLSELDERYAAGQFRSLKFSEPYDKSHQHYDPDFILHLVEGLIQVLASNSTRTTESENVLIALHDLRAAVAERLRFGRRICLFAV